ncbi:interleukin 19 like [Eucyclogobius newberryi]|uniref:interleukin 19 like n=1 Tax=Eucyclogobius newberryi TaxID=166745 RepID=UPI003B5BFBFE
MRLQCLVPLCFFLLLSGWPGQRSEARTVILEKCVVNVHMSELHKHYSGLRASAISGDAAIEVKLLDKEMIKSLKEGQTCCFLRLLLRFYVERVFVSFSASQVEQQREASAVANGFVSLRNNIHKCHCQCEEDTQRSMDSIIAEFDELPRGEAAKKAVGELDTVLSWLEVLSPKTRSRK